MKNSNLSRASALGSCFLFYKWADALQFLKFESVTQIKIPKKKHTHTARTVKGAISWRERVEEGKAKESRQQFPCLFVHSSRINLMKAKLTPTYAFASAHKSLLSLPHTRRHPSPSRPPLYYPSLSLLFFILLSLLPFRCCFAVPFFRWPQCGGARVKLYARLKLRRMSMMSTVRVNSWRTK